MLLLYCGDSTTRFYYPRGCDNNRLIDTPPQVPSDTPSAKNQKHRQKERSSLLKTRVMDRGSSKSHTKRSTMERSPSENDCGLLLSNPNASEDDSIISPKMLSAERLSTKGKPRSKSPSFFKMLVGGLRKLSTQELEDADANSTVRLESTSLSDTEDPTFSPILDKTEQAERQRIDHLATLPRNKPPNWRRPSTEKMAKISLNDDFEENHQPEPILNSIDRPFAVPVSTSPNREQTPLSESSLFTEPQVEYHSVGLDALEILHNQLQILVRQDCDEDMADFMEDKVIESLRKQMRDLQHSLECLQQSDQNLRLSLKVAELKTKEAEIKLHHSTKRCHKLERDCRWLETEFKILYQKYHDLQKHLQKKAVLHQISVEQKSPSRHRRPNSTQPSRRQRSFDTSSVSSFSPVKRHNSSELIYNQQHRNNTHVDPISTLPPRLHSGSLSHTETRV